MTKKFVPLLTSLLLLHPLSQQGISVEPTQVEAYESKVVSKISIHMENLPPGANFDPKTVLSRLKTKEGDPFSQSTFDNDLKTLSNEYDRVEPQLSVQNGQVYISLHIWARPTIRSIKWVGNEHVKTKTLQSELDIPVNSVYNRYAFNKAFNKVKEYYIKKGYFESQLQYVVKTDPKTNQIEIEILVQEGRSGKIDDIRFEGFSKEEQSQILDMIYMKKYNLFLSWITGKGIYNEEAVEQDQLTIVNFLQNKGYADAKVQIHVLESKSGERIAIEIKADRGQIFHFGKITFDGNTLFNDEQIESMFLIHPEETYSPEKMRESADNIKSLYGRIGHIDTNVLFDTQLVENAPIYNVHYQIEEGKQYKIGLIHVVGNTSTSAHVILRESYLVPGETFDSARLKATQHRLENMGYFKNVNVYAVRAQDDQSLGENYRDVYIEVEESSTGNASIFGSLSSADGLIGGLDLSETNFNYKGLGQVFTKGPSAVRGGGEYAHAKFSIGSKQRSYLFSWMDPYFRDSLWRVGFDVNKTYSKLQADDYSIDTIGGSVFASYPLNPYWTFGTKYRVKYSDVHIAKKMKEDVKKGKQAREQAKKDGTYNPTKDKDKIPPDNTILSGVGSYISFDSTDSSLKPRNGFRSTLEAEIAGVGGDVYFMRYSYINSYYSALWSKGTMKYRYDFRFIQPIGHSSNPGDIPLSERYFLGGVASVRGYRDFDLGPHFNHSKDPTGGISSSLLSVEYLQNVIDRVDAFVFTDAGSVSLKRFAIPKYNISYGFGVRLEVMNRMPFIFGLGFPVNPDNHHQVRRFFFSMGGQF